MIGKKHILLGDLIIISAIIFLSLILFVFDLVNNSIPEHFSVQTPDGKTVYSLDKDSVIELESNGIKLDIAVENGAVFVAESNCSDQICVRMGKINKGGDVIVCLPAKIVISIDNTDARSEADAEAG